MGERTTSRAEAAYMRCVIEEAVDTLRDCGFNDGQIGSVLFGIGAGKIILHRGAGALDTAVGAVRRAALAVKAMP